MLSAGQCWEKGCDTGVDVAQGQEEGSSGLSSLNPREEVSCQMFLRTHIVKAVNLV